MALIRNNTGVYIKGGAGAVSNFATIAGEGYKGQGVNLVAGGAVTNGSSTDTQAKIYGVAAGIDIGGAGTAHNYGLVTAAAYGVGIELGSGNVTNGSNQDTTAQVEGRTGLLVSGASQFFNYAAVLGLGGAGVNLGANSVILNLTGGLIEGYDGVLMGAGGTTYNFGNITAIGGYGAEISTGELVNESDALLDGKTGVFASGAASIINTGIVRGSQGVGAWLNSGGSLSNGSADSIHALIEGHIGVRAVVASVTNLGTVIGYQGYGVQLTGGSVTNGSATDTIATIQGSSDGVSSPTTAATVVNYGTIRGLENYGVSLDVGGSLTNGSLSDTAAMISGPGGVSLETGASAINFGSIIAENVNVGAFLNNAVLTNGTIGDNKAVIEGAVGVKLGPSGVLDNFGTVIGIGGAGDAVTLADSTSRLIVEGGSRFTGSIIGNRGQVDMYSGTGTLRLLSNANEVVSGSMPTTTFTNFGLVEIGGPAKFTLTGTGYVPDDNVLQDEGSLSVATALDIEGNANPADAGELDTGGTLTGAGTLSIAGGGAAYFGRGTQLTIAHVNMSGATSVAEAITGEHLTYTGVWTQTAGTVESRTGFLGPGSIAFTGVGNSFAGTIAGQAYITAGTDTFSSTTIAGDVTVSGGALTMQGTITLGAADELALNGGKAIVASTGVHLAGGTLSLGDAANLTGATTTATLTNVNDEVIGAGVLGGGKLRIVNDAGGAIVAGTSAVALTIDTGANVLVNAGKIQSFSTGGLVIKGAVSNSGMLIADGGDLTVDGAVTSTAGSAQVGDLSILKFASSFSQNVLFGSENSSIALSGTLELAKSTTYHGTISGFSTTGTTSLDLDDIAFSTTKTKATYSGTTTGGVLTVTDGTHTAKISFAGDYTTVTFTVATDNHGGTTVSDQPGTTPTAAPVASASASAFVGAMASMAGGAGGAQLPSGERAPAGPRLLAPPAASSHSVAAIT